MDEFGSFRSSYSIFSDHQPAIQTPRKDGTKSSKAIMVIDSQHYKLRTEATSKAGSSRIVPAWPSVNFNRRHQHVHSSPPRRQMPRSLLPIVSVIALLCVVWTSILVVLMLAPNEVANKMMNTGGFDDGQFWLIVDPEPAMKYLAVAGLLAVDLGYVWVLISTIFWRRESFSMTESLQLRLERWIQGHSSTTTWRPAARHHLMLGIDFWKELTAVTGRYRKHWNALLKSIDLVLLSLQLHEMLESGSPKVMMRAFTLFVSCNALSYSIMIVCSNKFSVMAEIFIDAAFDLVAAIGFPIAILAYSYINFDIDRRAIEINIKIIPPGHFERNARMISDPSEIALFLDGLNALRILSFSELFIRLSMNLSFCNRFRGVVDTLARDLKHHIQVHAQIANESLEQQQQLHQPVPRLVASLFVSFAALVIAYSEHAMESSTALCSDHPQCAVYAYRWSKGDFCPCLTLIDADRSPRTFSQWMNPVDVTATVKALSASGDLRVLQLINRGLPLIPDELRKCRELQYVSLLYTGVEAIPSWMKDFKRLEYLHIEGKELFTNILTLDADLLSDLPRLTFLLINSHDHLQELPPLSGVPNLRSLVFAHMFSLSTVPALDRVPNLQRLQLSNLPTLEYVPDLTPLTKLVFFAASRGAYYCCNGFRGTCDLSDLFCLANAAIGTADAVCLDASEPHITDGTTAIFDRFENNVCRKTSFSAPNKSDVLTREIIEVCDGIRYRQCEYPPGSGLVGICYNNRLQVLSCVTNPNYIALRRAQITANVGPRCDPVVEAWLGCEG